ncbi:MAG TPA: GNAT family N-acetyltransferase [Aggregatilineales bacterium]|nr:GNAT family N-acetyltransferase [Aggregatilineales bacterium]
MDLTVRPLEAADREWLRDFSRAAWGAEIVVAHGVIYRPHELPGFVALDGATPIGASTFQIEHHQCEIVTIASLRERMGVGKALINAVVEAAQRWNCTRVWLITTNDNTNALRFYQKRGFRLVAVHRDAVMAARALKPEIPLIGLDGIPIRDEIELEMLLT